jgi:hypothetical protein
MALTLVGGVIGPNVDEITSPPSGTTTTGAYAPQPLGTVIDGVDGTRYVLVQAASTSAAMASVKAPNAYALLATGRAKLMTSAQAGAGLALGFAPPKVIAGRVPPARALPLASRPARPLRSSCVPRRRLVVWARPPRPRASASRLSSRRSPLRPRRRVTPSARCTRAVWLRSRLPARSKPFDTAGVFGPPPLRARSPPYQ